MSSSTSSSSKILYVVRHGQAMHNPRAEAAKEKGCSMEEFFRLMQEDDVLDADLTPLGREQARQCHQDYFSVDGESSSSSSYNPLGIDLVVASCLSRTIDTADLAFPPASSSSTPKRICVEKFREVNGSLLNGKRRTKSELMARNPNWNFDSLESEEDDTWTPELEKFEDTAERGYQGLVELLTGETTSPETNVANEVKTILLVCHGGILRYLMTLHPLVHLSDERTTTIDYDDSTKTKSVESRFDNCELRKYRLSWKDDIVDANTSRRAIVLTQLDH